MIKNVSIGKKIWLGYISILSFLVVVGIFSIISIESIINSNKIYQDINAVRSIITEDRNAIGIYINSNYDEGRERQGESRDHAMALFDDCFPLVKNIKEDNGDYDANISNLINQIETRLKDYHRLFSLYVASEDITKKKIEEILALEKLELESVAKGPLWTEAMHSATKILFSTVKGYFQRNTVAGLHKVEASFTTQVATIDEWAATWLAHVKPHGSLYLTATEDETTTRIIAETIAKIDSDLTYVVLGGPKGANMGRLGKESGLKVIAEAFPGRAYAPDEALLPRDYENAVLTDPEEIPEVLHLARSLRKQLEAKGIEILSPIHQLTGC